MAFDEKQTYIQIVEDICGNDYPKYDNLVIFVHNLLHKRVKRWCYNDLFLRGGMHEDDVMQEIQIRIIKKCEAYFFKPVDGKTEKNCDDFKAWCYRVAKNYFITYCVKRKNRKEVELELSIKCDDDLASSNFDLDVEASEETDANRQELKRCFEIVLDLKSKPHIVLTWLSVSLYMLYSNSSKIEATHMIVEKFSGLTLDEMLRVIIILSARCGWIELSERQCRKQMEKLEVVDKNTGKKIGEMRYEEFYMSKGPEMSISDWINRVNEQIKKKSGAK